MASRLPFLRSYPPHLERLRRLSLFSDLTLSELAIVDAVLHERDYAKREVIFDEGEVGQTIYFVLEGEVKICRQGRPDDGQLALLGAGEFFSELGLLDDSVRTAQARAATDCRLLVLFRDDFSGLMDSHLRVAHTIGRQLLRHMGQRLRELGLAVGAHRHL